MSTVDYEYASYTRHQPHQNDYKEIGKALNEVNIFSSNNFSSSLFDYLNLSINQILCSENPIIRAFGMLDARVGKRRLTKIQILKEHELVKRLFFLRCDAEGIIDSAGNVDLTSRITSPFSRTRHNLNEEAKQKAIRKLENNNKIRNFKTLLFRIFNDEFPEDELDTEISRALYEGFRHSSDAVILFDALKFLDSKTKLCDDVVYVKAFIAMAQDHDNWIKPLEGWKPLSHNRNKQFSSLARHLWAQYDVPLFMDKAWLQGYPAQQQWYKDIGIGKNIRNSENLLVPLTKKMAHCFLSAPDEYSIEGALRWGQIHALGGDKRLADAILATRLVEDFRDNDFWLSVIRFFVRNPMLDTVHISPIVDYIWNQKYEDRIIFVDRGVAEEAGPEQPNFSIRGRTVDSLLRAVAAWHGQLGKESKSSNLQWPKSGVNDFRFIEGNKKNKNMKIWRIKELLSSKELVAEGRHMRHCVATYASSCHRGTCSIWTLDLETEEGKEKLLTVEVNNTTKEIRQIRGKRNRYATDYEKAIIKRWASREELIYASYLL